LSPLTTVVKATVAGVGGGGVGVDMPSPPQLGSRSASSNRELTGNQFLNDIKKIVAEIRNTWPPRWTP
jgi:hypothetical protein